MTDPRGPSDLGGGIATTGLFAFSAAVLGLLGGLPEYLGPAIGVGGVAISAVWRTFRRDRPGAVTIAPALIALATLAVAAPALASTELFGGLSGLAFLLWLADDPSRPRGGGRRAAPAIAMVALAVGVSWAITLGVPGRTPEIGLAGGLLAAAFVLLAWLVSRPQVVLLSAAHARNR